MNGSDGEAGRRRRVPKPLDEAMLDELALSYLGRFATTRAKLRTYLQRKLRERGWAGQREPDVAALAERLAGAGLIDDKGFAEARTASLLRRGYGRSRVRVALQVAGIEEDDRAPAMERAEEGAWEAALAFARRRRIGPFAAETVDPAKREKLMAAMLRAGHRLDHARTITRAAPGEIPEERT